MKRKSFQSGSKPSRSKKQDTNSSKPKSQQESGQEKAIPNQTLYIRNLDTKVSTHDLRTLLYMLFGAYGRICGLNTSKSHHRRGQAHIGFESASSASIALRDLQGMLFLGKPMHIEYSKTESHRVEWQKSYAM